MDGRKGGRGGRRGRRGEDRGEGWDGRVWLCEVGEFEAEDAVFGEDGLADSVKDVGLVLEDGSACVDDGEEAVVLPV